MASSWRASFESHLRNSSYCNIANSNVPHTGLTIQGRECLMLKYTFKVHSCFWCRFDRTMTLMSDADINILAILQYELFLRWLSKLALHDDAIKSDEMLTYPDHLVTLSVCFCVVLVVSNFVCLCLYCCIYDRGRPIIRISLSFSAFVGYTILLSFRGGRNHDPRNKTKSRSFVLRREQILPYENALKWCHSNSYNLLLKYYINVRNIYIHACSIK
jgi:hypothetical protein